ncbi:MAG: MBL fold metallo-hydrolase [Christensenellaceae bacterium]|jgi:glyoxylase-like metal-dependent hydrolase (beta-lactamase superfamily II)|nr:MBL fold metallo-hydrolase [Christensenellaceae bacterium]
MKVIKFIVGAFKTNCYLAIDEKLKIACLIDPGSGYDKIRNYCDDNGLKLSCVLITHGHFDHVTEVGRWKMDGLPVYIHELDASYLTLPKRLGYSPTKQMPQIVPDRLLKDGDEIAVGDFKLTVMHTPGHTEGSVCYIGDGVIFSGDTLFKGDYGRVDLPGGNFNDIKKSLKRLFSLPGNYVVNPGHDIPTDLDTERKTNIILGEL